MPEPLAPKWIRRRKRFEVPRLNGPPAVFRRTPLARASLDAGWSAGHPFAAFLASAISAAFPDARVWIVGLNGAYRDRAHPAKVDESLIADGVDRGALCANCGRVLVVEHVARRVVLGLPRKWRTSQDFRTGFGGTLACCAHCAEPATGDGDPRALIGNVPARAEPSTETNGRADQSNDAAPAFNADEEARRAGH